MVERDFYFGDSLDVAISDVNAKNLLTRIFSFFLAMYSLTQLYRRWNAWYFDFYFTIAKIFYGTDRLSAIFEGQASKCAGGTEVCK